jgi:single-stranded-DNA-specific exonuclease
MFSLHDPLDDALRAELMEYDDLTASLLARRGITTKEDAERFLAPSYDLHLHDPLSMTDMPKAAELLARAIRKSERIAVWSDYDCDGGPGGVILHDFLTKAGASFENYIPHRHLEGYGMNAGGLETLADRGTRLVISVDSGITDVAPVARARELEMDVIITDHHLPGAALPDAYAVVDPKARPDERYPFKELCGAGLAWKLVCATLATEPARRTRVPGGWEKWLLDMAGLATIADMVPLTGENRVLATYGLLVMRKSPRLGFQKLCRAIRVNQRFISEDDVGFMVAPRVNAASRMGDAYDVLTLFTTADEAEAEAAAKRLEAANRARKAAAGAITRAVRARLKEREVRTVIAMGDPAWRPALLGLVANGIAEEYGRPVFLWGREGNLACKGSVRSGGGVHALELMGAAEDTFEAFGGHAASGGFTVREDAIFTLEERLVAAFERLAHARAREVTDALHADAVLAPHEVTRDVLASFGKLAPFGAGNAKPVFLVRGAQVARVMRFGKGAEHLKLSIAREGAEPLDAIAFFAKGALAARAASLPPGARTDLLAHLERDAFARGAPVRLRILDLAVV